MFKQSKTHISLLLFLGAMVSGQIGFALYFGSSKEASVQEERVYTSAKSGPAQAFGLTAPREKHVEASSVKELNAVFQNCSYDLKTTKKEGTAPRIYLASLPKDMKGKKAAKNAFILALLPHILKVNEEILADRQRLLDMKARVDTGGHLRHSEKLWLGKLASEYRCKSTKIDALLVHVDIVPPSLALAQAILETGWGRSHAAINKNSTFGHMRTKKDVMSFPSLEHNVRAYINNLNRHLAYKVFRDKRKELRKENESPSGLILASGLQKYSVRGNAYIRDIQGLINNLELKQYDPVVLEQQKMRLKP